MRNLKRALSLALATVMTLGLMVVGTGAVGYTDVTSEDNQEAIEVLQAVGVMSGVTEDEFSPDTPVTRNQMAVIMCQLLDYTVSTYKGTTNFTDVASWALPYVEACYTNGIIAGYSDTQFGGEDPVTTGQAALMIMKALGYFQEPGDFGQDWLVETVRQGAQIQLFNGVDNGAREPLTRNDVAQIVLNALKAECVEITSHDLVSDGNGGFTTKAVYTARTASGAKYDAIDDETNGAGNRIVNLGEDLYDGDLVLRGGDEAFGRPSVEWTYNSRTVGTYALEDDLLATYTAKVSRGDLYSLVGSTVVNRLEDTRDNASLYVYLNGEPAVGTSARVDEADVDNYFDRNNSTAIGTNLTGNGVLTEVYTTDNDDIIIVIVDTYLVKATADYNETRESLNIETVDIDIDNTKYSEPVLPAVIENEDVNVSDFKEGDYILVTYSEKEDAIMSAEPAELLTANVDEYTVTEEVVLNGEIKKYNMLTGADVSGVEYTINEDAVVVLDKYGYIIYVDQAVATSSYVYIADVGTTSVLGTKAIAAAYFADGTFDEITLSKVYDYKGHSITSATALGNGSNVHGWYTFTKNSNDEYTLSTLNRDAANNTAGKTVEVNSPDDGASAQTFIENGKVNFIAGDTTVKGDEDTVFVVRDADQDVTVYTGVANVPTVTIPATAVGVTINPNDAKVNYALDKNGYATYVFIDVTNDAIQIEDVNDAADFLFLLEQLDGNRTVADGTTYYRYKVILDGEISTKYLADQMLASGGDDKGTLYTNVKENADGYITNGTAVTTDGAKKYALTMIASNQDTITRGSGAITVDYTSGVKNFLTADADINLIIDKTAQALLKDKGASYESYLHISANSLAGMLSNYYLSGTAYAVVTENGGEKATDIYVYVTAADLIEAPSAPVITGVTINGNAADVYADKTSAQAAPVAVTPSITHTVTANATGGATITLNFENVGITSYPNLPNGHTFTIGANGDKWVVEIVATNSAGTTKAYVAINASQSYTITDDTTGDDGMTAVATVDSAAAGATVTVNISGIPDITKTYTVKAGTTTIAVLTFDQALQTTKTVQFTMPTENVTLDVTSAPTMP